MWISDDVVTTPFITPRTGRISTQTKKPRSSPNSLAGKHENKTAKIDADSSLDDDDNSYNNID